MDCALFREHIGTFLNGELDAKTQVEAELHLERCSECQEHLEFEGVYRDLLTEEVGPAPDALRERVHAALLAEADGGAEVVPLNPEEQTPLWLRGLGYVVPFAAAAAVALGIGVSMGGNGAPAMAAEDAPVAQGAAVDPLEEVVRLQSVPVQTVSTENSFQANSPREVSQWFSDKVEFPVRSAEFEGRDARLVGARLSHVRQRRAAALFYELENGERITMVVTDAPMTQAQTRARNVQGFPVSVRREGGLTYAFTGNVDRATLHTIASSARVSR